MFSPVMTHEEIDRLAHGAEHEFQEHPAAYRRKVALLAALGYTYLLVLLLVSLGSGVVVGWIMISNGWGFAAIKIALVLMALGFTILQALWVKFPEPAGVTVSPTEAPALYTLVNGIADQAGAPRPDQILLDTACNASVSQRPRLGPLGWYRNTLTLGVPLLAVLTPTQATAVLAHEFGHLAGGHGRFGSWIYRIRMTWALLDATMRGSRRIGSWFVRWFLDWYAPYFGAYSQVLARQHEFAADEFAARVVGGPAAMGEALIALEVRGEVYAKRAWPEVWSKIKIIDRPPEYGVRAAVDLARQPIEAAWGERVVAAGLRRAQRSGDSHPPLKARLAALGVEPGQRPVPLMVEESALQSTLGPEWPVLVERVERFWGERVQGNWRQKHIETQGAARRLAALNEQEGREGRLSLPHQWERIECARVAEGVEACEPLLRAFLVQSPGHGRANFLLGALLLERDDGAGVPYLEAAIRLDQSVELAARGMIRAFWERTGEQERAEAEHRQVLQSADVEDAAKRERMGVTQRDRLAPPQLEDRALQTLRNLLAAEPQVRRAWLGRKVVKIYQERPYYILAVDVGVPWYRMKGGAVDRRVITALIKQSGFPGQTLVCSAAGSTEWL